MDKVASCVELLPELFDAWLEGDDKRTRDISDRIKRLEHDADLVKHDIRDSLPRGLFMPVDRANLLRVLRRQDGIANRAEDIAVLVTFKSANSFKPFTKLFRAFLTHALETFAAVQAVIGQLDELVESGFGGAEAEKVRGMVDGVAHMEYESDGLQHDLIRELLSQEDQLSYGDFFLWTKIVQQVGELSDLAENLATSVRAMLELK